MKALKKTGVFHFNGI